MVLTLMMLLSGVVHAQPRIVAWGDNFYGQTNIPPGLFDVKAIAAGNYHNLALRSNGTVVAWGDNTSKQTNVPPGLSGVMAIAAGGAHSMALRSNGTVVAWGLNGNGQTNVPSGLASIASIAAGGFHSMARRSNGTVIAWGRNSSGQTNVPAGLANVAAISAGDTHSMALLSNGTVVAWGDNGSGQTNTPANLTNAMAIAAGYHHNLAIRTNGAVAAWELNVYGESNVPVDVTNPLAIAASYFHSMAIRSNGTVAAWGQNFSGQADVPPGLTNVVAIAAGHDHNLAIALSPVCPPGFPDNFECRQILEGSNVTVSASSLGATQEPGEPSHSSILSGNASVWFTWTAPASGGVVLTVNSVFGRPILAVYTGTVLTNLTPLANNASPYNYARLVFNAVAGTTYQIAVDSAFSGGLSEGDFTLRLQLNPPPANDLFANTTPIPNGFFQTSGSFIGATTEPGEPVHTNANGNAAFQQTLWWTWTAPTNLGVTTIPVKLTADGVSFPPNLGVYTGTSLANLTSVVPASQTNGMTRVASFLATAGTTYRIALGGLQYDAVGNNISTRFGNYRLRLDVRALVLSISGLAQTNPVSDGPVSFGANAVVTNFGSASSYPLRIQVSAISGIGTRGLDNGFSTNDQIILTTTNLSSLAPGLSATGRISGTVPAPIVYPGDTNGVGYGAYAALQEQVDTNWFTVDEVLVLYGNWPDLGGFAGPGGGVIRLDPGLGGSLFNPLTNVSILGPSTVNEGTKPAYSGRARYASGFQIDFTNTVWSSTRFTITNGLLNIGSVTSNSPAA